MIEMTPSVYRDYKRTIARHEPETAALLGGSLEAPNFITEFRFCPPSKGPDGRYKSGGSHVAIDADLMNWIVVNEWQPNGLYVLGFWHSHPGWVTSPSGEHGDLGLFRAAVDNDDARQAGWRRVLAPITTFDREGQDCIHGWTYDQGDAECQPADIRIRHQDRQFTPQEFEAFCAQPRPAERPKEQKSGLDAFGAEAERLARTLALGRNRLRQQPGLTFRERRRMLRQHRQLEQSLMTTFKIRTAMHTFAQQDF